MRPMLKPVIAASAQAIWARKDHPHAFLGPPGACSTRSTLATDLHPERSNWCSSKHRRTASTSAETMHSTRLAADHLDHLGTPWKHADQQRGPQAPACLIRCRPALMVTSGRNCAVS